MKAETDAGILYRQWRVCFNAYFAKRVGYEAAEDLTQELFVRYMNTRAKGTRIIYPQRWLWRTAYNLVIDVYRERARRPACVLTDVMTVAAKGSDVVDALAPDPLELALEWDDCMDVVRCLSQLSPVQLEAVVLRHRNGWPYQRIADAAGISLGAAKARHRRAVDKLQELMRELR